MCVCVHRNILIHVCIYTHIYIYTYIYLCARAYSCVCVCVRAGEGVCKCVCVHLCKCMCMHKCVCMCVCVCQVNMILQRLLHWYCHLRPGSRLQFHTHKKTKNNSAQIHMHSNILLCFIMLEYPSRRKHESVILLLSHYF